jgi:hypothetical protein
MVNATLNTLVRYTGHAETVHLAPTPVPIGLAMRWIEDDRKTTENVQVYETTDRDGHPLHVVYVHFGAHRWRNADDVVDVFEIPAPALTHLGRPTWETP